MQTIGERLEEARKRKGISIREAAEATKIRGDYLQKFESNQFDLGLAELYVRGFLRSYAQFLKLPADKIVNDFNALTAGSSSTRRAPSREVYGRMDLSVASADEPDAGGGAAAAPAGEAETGTQRRSPASFTRGGGSIPQGPAIDPNLIVKGAVVVVAIVVLALIVWGVKSLFSGGSTSTANPSGRSGQAAAQATPTFKLIALGPVVVEVNRPKSFDRNSPDNHVPGDPVFRENLATGTQRDIPWTSEFLITASAWENLDIEVGGGSVPRTSGRMTRRLPAP